MCKTKLSDKTPYEKSKHAKGLCLTKYCRHEHVQGRWQCRKCINLGFAERHPLRYVYNNWKNNARRRGIEFTVTLEQFTKFAEKNNYVRKRGRTPKSMTIDRIVEGEGYHANNIQAITLTENIYKYKLSKSSKKLKEETPF